MWKLLSHVQLCDSMDYTVRRIHQARILECVAFPFSRVSSQPRDQTQVSCIASRFFTSWATIYIQCTHTLYNVQLSSFAQSCPTLCNPMDYSTPGFPVHHQLLELVQTHVHGDGDAIQPSHPLLSPSPPTFNLSQHHGLFQWVSSSHQLAKVLEFQLQHQSFQWIFRTDFL